LKLFSKARCAQLALLVCGIVSPFLFLWTIDLVAHRKEFRDNVFWLAFFCTIGIWFALYFWVTRTFRAVFGKKPPTSQTQNRVNRWLLIGVMALTLSSVILMLTDHSFGAWTNVNATVILSIFVLPATVVSFLILAISRLIAFAPKTRPVSLQYITMSSRAVFLCSVLLMLVSCIYGGVIAIKTILINGRVLSLAYKIISRNISPESYWTYTELYIGILLIIIIVSLAALPEILAQETRRQSTLFQKILLYGSGIIFSALIALIVWFVSKNS
jgi:hypothetical protein